LSFLWDNPSWISLGQGALGSTPENLNDMARGQLAFGQFHYPYLRPRFGLIDELGNSDAKVKAAKKIERRLIFWANFFGPTYAEKFGRKFLRGAPGWKNEELDDGGILYVVTECYYDWWSKPPKDVLDYFHKEVPGVKLYKAKSFDY
jgi:hypothetical protein